MPSKKKLTPAHVEAAIEWFAAMEPVSAVSHDRQIVETFDARLGMEQSEAVAIRNLIREYFEEEAAEDLTMGVFIGVLAVRIAEDER